MGNQKFISGPPATWALVATGTVVVPVYSPADLERVIGAIEQAIRAAKPTAIFRRDGEITFHAGCFRVVGNWNQLIPIGVGQLRFSPQENRVEIFYRISFFQFFVVTAILTLIVFGLVPWMASGMKATPPIGVILLLFLWIFGGNCVITLFRFPHFLKKAAEGATAQC
jgi:hypothetical protein